MTNAYSIDTSVSKQVKPRSTKQLTTAQFIRRARLIHADRNYDYRGVVYTNNRAKVFIICPEHGFFAQTAKDHLTGRGCRGCGINQVAKKNSSNLELFLLAIKKVHIGKCYSYDKTVYSGNKNKIIVTCSKHGDFKQIASDHLNGSGCQKCAHEIATKKRKSAIDRKRMERGEPKPIVKVFKDAYAQYTTELFISRATHLHGGVYDYSQSIYVNSNTKKLAIMCNEHGVFWQTPNSHLRGRGCPDCGKLTGGYSRTNFQDACDKNHGGYGYLYVIQCFKGDEVFYKVGRTSNSVSSRFSGKGMPYSYREVYVIYNLGGFVFDMERELHKLLSKFRHEPSIYFEGRTECFTTIKPIEQLLKKLANTEQLQLIA